jgi:hypothetical protein
MDFEEVVVLDDFPFGQVVQRLAQLDAKERVFSAFD